MKKTHYLIGICCAFLLQACQGSGSSSVVTKQENNQATGAPNILFILLDDLGYGDVGYLGSQIQTPNIDNLASQGVTLKHGYAYPICSPTRAALMTGKNPLNFGIDGPMENDAMLPEDLTTMPERFQEAGYQTWMVGKWHLGMAKRSAMPHNRGFDDFYGFLGGFVDYYTHVYFGGLDWQNNDTSLREEGFVTELLTSDVDQDIGEVLAALDKRGIAENTIVVFMSDNGGNLEAGANNGSLQGGKSSVYEGGVRVPVLIRWPAQLQSKTMTQPMFTQDWAPTLLEAANIDYQPNDFDGVSQFVNLKEAQEKTFKREVVVGTAKQKAVYQWPWKLIVDAKGNKHLFNLSQDEFEHSDVAMEHPELVAQLMSELTLLPHLPSKAAKGPPPESLFLDAHGLFDYNVRKAETRKPWLETAL